MRQLAELRPYQQRIATHLYEHDAALCVLRPGGGKTAAALTAISDMLRDGIVRHALILAPKRVARVVWPDEIAEWKQAAGLRYQVLDGSPAERAAELLQAHTRAITIVGLDIILWLLDELNRMPADHPLFDLLVIDEISRLRNPTGVRAKALSKAASRWRMIWGLSGTLRPNSALDLFNPAKIVSKGALWGKSFYTWRGKHFYPIDYQGYDWQPLPGAEDKLNRDIAPLTITVSEDEMPTVEPTIVVDKVSLPLAVRTEYDRMQHSLVADLDDDRVIAGSAAIATGKLAQMANGFIYNEDDNTNCTQRLHAAKREWLLDVVQDATGPTLLIYEYLADLDMLREELGADLPYLGAGVSDLKAASNIKSWNAGKLPFMALHPASGGHGLNLQHGGADMAWICPTWSPEFWEQTIARLARPGQRRPVVVRVCVAEDTVDELKLARVRLKLSAQEAFEAWLQGRAPGHAPEVMAV
jgi:hypothetical protein